jgi:hypothetical protein
LGVARLEGSGSWCVGAITAATTIFPFFESVATLIPAAAAIAFLAWGFLLARLTGVSLVWTRALIVALALVGAGALIVALALVWARALVVALALIGTGSAWAAVISVAAASAIASIATVARVSRVAAWGALFAWGIVRVRWGCGRLIDRGGRGG